MAHTSYVGTSTAPNEAIVILSAATGAVLRTVSYPSSKNTDPLVRSLLMDNLGNVYVQGMTGGVFTCTSCYFQLFRVDTLTTYTTARWGLKSQTTGGKALALEFG